MSDTLMTSFWWDAYYIDELLRNRQRNKCQHIAVAAIASVRYKAIGVTDVA
jgi:hypothetical protein